MDQPSSTGAPSTVSIITACCGPLSILDKVLPSWAQSMCKEIIVVQSDVSNSDCINFDLNTVRVICCGQQPLSRAASRNLGARAATGEWLLFIDSNIRLRERFSNCLNTVGGPGQFACIGNSARQFIQTFPGILLCPAVAYSDVGGFDDLISENRVGFFDLLTRFSLKGLTRKEIDRKAICPIDFAMKQTIDNGEDGANPFMMIYSELKTVSLLLTQRFSMPLSERQSIYEHVQKLTASRELMAKPELGFSWLHP